jgi:predicted transcriptional regulator
MDGPGESEKRITELFFHLSGTDRRQILKFLQEGELRLSDIARGLDLTPTEALRQLHRMLEDRLLDRTAEGRYRLTPFARLVLGSSEPLEFIACHPDYFLHHDAFLIPVEFRARIHELTGAEYIPTTIDTINRVTDMIRGAKHRLDSVILGTAALIEVMRERSQAGTKIRWLMHEGFRSKATETLRRWDTRPEVRVVPSVPGHIVVTESAALFTLRGLDGALTYDSFSGEDKPFRSWANDYFLYEWARARPWTL